MVSPVRKLSSAVYGVIQKSWAWAHSKNLLPSENAPIPVISVGAIAVGGSGKTPFTMLMAEKLHEMGHSPVICSRGYKGSYSSKYVIVTDGKSDEPFVGPEVCGDEPFLMAKRLKRVPVVVARKRIDAIDAAHKFLKCDVAILDDGFQHLRLKRDINLALLKAGPDSMFPSGNLREPFESLTRADIILLDGLPEEIPSEVIPYINGKPIFITSQVADCLIEDFDKQERVVDLFDGHEVILVSAIANPKRFRDMAQAFGWTVIKHEVFSDHRRIPEKELSRMMAIAENRPVVLTEKDWVKTPFWFRNRSNTFALRIKACIDNEADFWNLIVSVLNKNES